MRYFFHVCTGEQRSSMIRSAPANRETHRESTQISKLVELPVYTITKGHQPFDYDSVEKIRRKVFVEFINYLSKTISSWISNLACILKKEITGPQAFIQFSVITVFAVTQPFSSEAQSSCVYISFKIIWRSYDAPKRWPKLRLNSLDKWILIAQNLNANPHLRVTFVDVGLFCMLRLFHHSNQSPNRPLMAVHLILHYKLYTMTAIPCRTLVTQLHDQKPFLQL